MPPHNQHNCELSPSYTLTSLGSAKKNFCCYPMAAGDIFNKPVITGVLNIYDI